MTDFVTLLWRPGAAGGGMGGERRGETAGGNSWHYVPPEASWGVRAVFDKDTQILINIDLEEEGGTSRVMKRMRVLQKEGLRPSMLQN
uniref:Uncharacterized protein n=1 Tax=Chromera velia CCMP2878 TaxID=1169474 RepID=A0A0G4GSI8_9ALVE|eukprot:Cvel_23184.t1-p1 / transcript=Cvel_23184.t1 / gene=Cvel_23184 / organism=Chromera_velia_CCMP2878 / gene_product=hypothetical protein / transcript_product=hypothetical protein / location=Cvel_scaffold2361:13064-13324(-) / protein_length=87 / sequence_SO=supercontig / SO=protein_coding / is_pseudo=false